MRKVDEGKKELRETYVPGRTRYYCDGCGKEVNEFTMKLHFNDFGDEENHCPAIYETWHLCGFRCFGRLWSDHETRKKIERMFNRASTNIGLLALEINERDLSVMADAANLLIEEGKA